MRRAALALLLPALLGAWVWLMPSWSIIEVLRPAILALDTDADGRLDADEMAEGSPVVVPFHKLDQDEDGSLDEPELLRQILAADPATFTGDRQQHLPKPDERFLYFPDPKPVRVLRVLFEFMAVEVRTADPTVPLPRYDDMVAASRTGSLASPEGQAVAANLVAAYQQAGLSVPAFLEGIEPVLAPILDPAETRRPGARTQRGVRPAFREGRPPTGQRPGGNRRPAPDQARPEPAGSP